MSVDNLTRMVAAEASVLTLTKVPEYYVETGKIILNKASDDISDADQLMTLIMDLKDRREAKMRTSIQKFIGQVRLQFKC
jgi:GINS complex subunit 2